jgi:hypothetical protein
MRRMTVETLKAYMRRAADRVGRVIAAEMGTGFGLMFDGWSSGTAHYLAVIPVYHLDDGPRERLIGLSPMEEGQTADAHIAHLDAILRVYNKDISMAKFLVGVNCYTNKAIATRLEIPLVGCVSRRFNLAMVRFLADHDDRISQIKAMFGCSRFRPISVVIALFLQKDRKRPTQACLGTSNRPQLVASNDQSGSEIKTPREVFFCDQGAEMLGLGSWGYVQRGPSGYATGFGSWRIQTWRGVLSAKQHKGKPRETRHIEATTRR